VRLVPTMLVAAWLSTVPTTRAQSLRKSQFPLVSSEAAPQRIRFQGEEAMNL